MKKTHFYISLLVSSFLLFIHCDNNVPQNCEEVNTEPFTGYYQVSEQCQQGFGHNVNFATIVPGFSASNNMIVFQNFNNSGQNVEAYVDCNGTYFRIPEQNVGSTAYTVVGEGNLINANGYVQLQFDVQFNEFGQANYCSYLYSK